MNEELTKQLQRFLNQGRVATHEDLKEHLDFFIKLVKEVKSQLESKIKEGDNDKEDKISSLIKSLYTSEANITKLVDSVKSENKKELDSLFIKFKTEIERLESSIPEIPEREEIDNSEIDEKIENLSLKLNKLEKKNNNESSLFNESFNQSIEDLNKKLELLKTELDNKSISRPLIGKTTLKILDNGTEVSSNAVELNFTNATSITTTGVSRRRVNIETGGSGGGSSVPIFPTSGAINSSNTAFVFSTEPDVIFANGTPLTLKSATNLYGFSWNSGTSTATLDTAPSTGTVVFAFSPVTSSDRDPGVITVADATSITPSTALYRIVHQTNTQSAGTLTINADSSTPADGRAFLLRIKSTNVQTLSFNAQYIGGTTALPTATTGSGNVDYFSFIYYASTSKYHYLGPALNYLG